MKSIIPPPLLTQMLKNGDETAIQYIISGYGKALQVIIFRIVKNEELTKDIFQEALTNIFLKADTYSAASGTLFTWMLNICRNLAIDMLRSKKYKNQQNTYSLDARPEESFDFNPDRIGVRTMLLDLTAKDRSIIELVYFLGFSNSEAAKELKIPVGSIATRKRYIISQLRKRYREPENVIC